MASIGTMDDRAVYVGGELLEFLGCRRTAYIVNVGILGQGDVTILADDVECPLDMLFL